MTPLDKVPERWRNCLLRILNHGRSKKAPTMIKFTVFVDEGGDPFLWYVENDTRIEPSGNAVEAFQKVFNKNP